MTAPAFVVHLRALPPHPRGVHARIAALLAADALGRGAPGPLAFEDAVVACAAGLRTYQFTPDDNWAWRDEYPDALFRWGSLDVDSYGVGETLALHLDRDIRRYDVAKPVECFGLLRHELEAGRPLLAERGHDLALIVGLERGATAWTLDAGAPTERVAYPAIDRAPEEGALAFATVLRPSTEPAPDSRRAMLWRDALGFPLQHARSKKELVHHEELFYASGARAWSVTRDVVAECARLPGFDAYWRAWCDAHACGRRAQADALASWGRVATQPAIEGLSGVAEAVTSAADAIEALGALDLSSPAMRVALDDAAARDAAALEALADVLPPPTI